MATTESKILSIDVTPGIDSLKKLRLEIKELKDALSTLEIGSKEYNETSEKLWEKQSRLTELIKDSKRPIEALEGSYDHLVAKMKELKAEWRATADEGRRNDLGKQILGINNQLKDLDASTGNFQRNVGDYKNAFSAAFDKMLGPLGKVNGTFGALARDVKGMIPLIKQVNSTALSGLKGIRAAIASTGIGLLIIAVGELAANWEKVLNWVNKNIVAQGDLNAAIEKNKQATIDLAKKLLATYQEEAEEYKRLDAMLAGEDMQRYTYKKRLIKVEQEHKEAVDNEGAAIKEYNNAVKDREKAEKRLASLSALATDNSRSAAEAELRRAQETENAAKREVDAAHKQSQKAVENIKLVQGELQKYDAKVNQSANITEQGGQKMKTAYDGIKASVDDLMKRLDAWEITMLTELDPTKVLQGGYADSLGLLEKALEQKKITEAQYVHYSYLLNEKFQKDLTKLEDDAEKERIKNLSNNYDKKIKEIDSTLSQSLKDLDFSQKLQDALLPKENMSFKDSILDSFNNIFGSQDTIIAEYSEKAKRLNDVFELNKQASLDRISVYEKELSELPDSSEEYLSVQAKISEEKINLNNLETQNFLDNLDLQEEQEQKQSEARQARFQLMQIGIQATANLLKQLASIQEQQLKDDVQNGKISEKEARKKFKTVKNMQYAAAVMETAQAAMGAYSALASIPYVGPALGIAAAAAAVAQGMMQIKQIQKTKFDSSGSGGGSDVNTPDMSAISNEYTPQYAQNMQTNSELSELSNAVGNISPVVQVVDIESGLNTSKVRVEETTF